MNEKTKELLERLRTTPDVVRLSSFKPEVLGEYTVGDLRAAVAGEAKNERLVPVDLAECLRILKAVRGDLLSTAEKRELSEAATIIDASYMALRELARRIERCGASIELTDAVSLCCDLASAIGNRWNPRNKDALRRVLDALDRSDR